MAIHRLPGELIAAATLPIAAAGTALGSLAPDEASWQKMIGPFGGLFLSIIFLCVFLRKDSIARKDRLAAEGVLRLDQRKREEKEEARRKEDDAAQERRHAETLQLQQHNSSQLLELSTASIRVQSDTAHAIQNLADEIRK